MTPSHFASPLGYRFLQETELTKDKNKLFLSSEMGIVASDDFMAYQYCEITYHTKTARIEATLTRRPLILFEKRIAFTYMILGTAAVPKNPW